MNKQEVFEQKLSEGVFDLEGWAANELKLFVDSV